jgi:transcriptional regulator with XRE-family HTH domain
MSAELRILGSVIREEREKRQLSQEHLASLAGLSRTYLGEVERGDTNLSVVSLLAIAHGLGILPSDLLSKYESRTKGDK